MHGTVGVVGVNTQANIFGIPGTPSFGDIIKTGVSLIPGVGPTISKFIPGGSGPPMPGTTSLLPSGPCAFGFSRDFPGAPCTLDLVPGPIGGSRDFEGGSQPPGEARVGQFGVGMEPGIVTRTVRVCLRGMQLGMDGLCYNKGVLKNSQREWPRGRAPLLTGGERNCLTTAKRVTGKIEREFKTLQDKGFIAKPRKSRPRARAQVATAPQVLQVTSGD